MPNNIKLGGTYVVALPSDKSISTIKALYNLLFGDVEDLETKNDYHVTLAYSHKVFNPKCDHSIVYPATISGVRLFSYDEDKKAIVFLLKSDALQKRFKQLKSFGATYDFDEYLPHVTVATIEKSRNDIKEMDFSFEIPLMFSNEYTEPLDE